MGCIMCVHRDAYVFIYTDWRRYYTCVYLRELIHELYHSDASLQPSHVVATIIIGQRPAIATIYSGTHTHTHIYSIYFMCVCVRCALPVRLLYIAAVARRCVGGE